VGGCAGREDGGEHEDGPDHRLMMTGAPAKVEREI
jgi:hypothetical protein